MFLICVFFVYFLLHIYSCSTHLFCPVYYVLCIFCRVLLKVQLYHVLKLRQEMESQLKIARADTARLRLKTSDHLVSQLTSFHIFFMK